MAKNPWDVVSVEPAEAADPWAVVSMDEAPKDFFSLDRAKEVVGDIASLIPGMGDLASKEEPTPTVQMTPQKIERRAAMDATERENLRAINPGAKDYQINALLEQKRAANPMPAPTLDDRAAGYLEQNATMSREDAERNAAFDVALEQRMNRRFQKAEADPITGERIAVAYQPERAAERTAFEQQQLDDARGNLAEMERRKDLKAMADENPLTMGVVQSLATFAAGVMQSPGTAERAVRQALGLDPSESVIPKSELAQRIYDVVRDTTADAAKVDLVDAIGTDQFFPSLAAQMAQNSVSNLMSLAAIFAPPLRAMILPGMGAMAAGNAELGGSSALAAVGKGAVEVGSELAFVKGFDKLGDLIKAIPPSARNTVLATAANRLLRTGATVTYAGLTGAIEEAAAQVGGNIIDRVVDGKNTPLMEGVGNAAILGAASGNVMGLPAAIDAATQPANAGQVAARALSGALTGGEFGSTDVVDILRQESSLTGGEIRPESTSRGAAIAAERVKLESMRASQTQNTRVAEVAITQAQSVDEAIALASNAVNQGSILGDITTRISQTDQLAATLEALKTNAPEAPVAAAGQPLDAGAAPSVLAAQPTAATAGLAGADATVAGGQPKPQPALTYPTAEAATAAAQQLGVADQVDVVDTSDGYVLQPQTPKPTVARVRSEHLAVSNLNAAIAAAGQGAGTVEHRLGWTPAASMEVRPVGAGDAGAGGAGQAAEKLGRVTELVARVAGKAFGVAPIPVIGLGNLGVAHNGQLYIDVDEVADYANRTGNADVAVAVATIGHEATHALLEKSSDPLDRQAYANFRAVVLAYAKPGVVQQRQASETQAAGGAERAGIYGTRGYAEGEVVADVSGAMWLDPKFWERLYDVDNGSTFRRVLYKFMQAATRFVEVAKGSRLDAGRFVTNVDAVREAAAQAWATRARGQKPPAEIASPSFSKYNLSDDQTDNPQSAGRLRERVRGDSGGADAYAADGGAERAARSASQGQGFSVNLSERDTGATGSRGVGWGRIGKSAEESRLPDARLSARLKPLEGVPRLDPVKAGTSAGPDHGLVMVAERYAYSIGLDLRRQAEFVQVNEDRALRLSDAYAAMPHAPQDPKVKEAYENLISQTVAQYRALEAAGYKFWLFGNDNDPYSGNPWAAMADLRENQSMAVYSTAAGFGTDGTFDPKDNPLLADTGIKWPMGSPDGPLQSVLANDLFRAVHDAFGHGLEGAGFRARGEENAWQAHVRLFTGTAVGAITSETRGQNSWLNYGPYSQKNQTASVFGTEFAQQKTGLMPEWTWMEGRAGDMQFSRPYNEERDTESKANEATGASKASLYQPDSRASAAGPGQAQGQNRVRDGAGRPDAQRSGGDGVVVGALVRPSGRADVAARRPGDRSAEGDSGSVRSAIHYGRAPGLTVLSGSSFGTGIKGAEQERLKTSSDPRIKRRVYFYLPTSGGIPQPEVGLGAHVYSADLDGLYDPRTASKPIYRANGNEQESAILDAGYKGYINPEQGTIVVLNTDVPVAYQGTSDQFNKVKRTPTVAKPKQMTRAEGQELVRKPEGQELSQIVRVREEVKFVAPSFRLQYGEARVLASEAAAADQVLADAGSSFQFGVPQFSLADDFDERGAFNLDANDEQLTWSEDFRDGLEVAKKDDLDFDALQAELDAEMNRGRERSAGRNSIEEPTDEQLKDAGLHPEKVVAFGPHTVRASDIILKAPGYLRVEHGVNYTISGFQGEYAPRTELDSISTFVSGGKRMSEQQAVAFTQNQLASEYLHKRFDLAKVYRKSTVMKIAEGWNALAKAEGAFKYPGAETKSKSFPEIAMAMGMLKDYKITVEYDEVVIFKNRKTGREFQATIMERGRDMACCTMGLNGSDLGVPFYVVAAKMAQNIGKPFVADETLSAINTLRRTEQALSFALRTGDTGVLLPGPQNRVYGYNLEPKTKADHNENIARLALANLRNVEELIPEVRRWTYDPATGQFGDEAKVTAALANPDVRAMGVGRTTVARAVLTNQLVMNSLEPGDIATMASPVLYSRVTAEEDPQPLSESWGELDARGKVELNPKFKAWFGDSKVVDAEGNPLVVYHGTKADVSEFRLDAPRNMAAFRDAQGFYFTKYPDDASAYTEGADGDPAPGANVMPVFLSIKNPLMVESGDIDNHPAYISEGRRKRLEDEGYDGIIYADGVEFVVFRSEQVKSAIGNNGQFDPANPDIRFSRSQVEGYMAQRNRGMRQVSAGSEQVNDIRMALEAMEALSAQMKPVHDRLSKTMSGEDLQRAVMQEFRNFVLPVGRVPHVLTMLGAPNTMMKIDPSIVYKVFVDKHANDLEGAKAKDIIEAIYKPAMVLRGKNKAEMELVLPIVTSTGPLIVPVMTDSVMPSNGGKVSAIMSIYPRKVSLGGNSVLQRMKDGNLAYADAALAQVALTGNASPQAGINAREVSLSSGTPPARTSTDNVSDPANLVKPVNPYYVGWDKASEYVLGGISAKKVKSDLDLMRWIGNNFRGEWTDAPAFSRGPGLKLDPEGRWLKVQRVMQDYFNRVDQVQQMIAKQGGVVREENDTYRAEERSYGRIHEAIKDFADKWVQPMVEKAAKANVTMDELSLYAYALHAKERNARVARINPAMPDGGSGMTNAEADAIIAQVNADPRAAAMKDLHQDLMAITATTRRVLLEEGLITNEQYAQLDGMYQNYVPLRGFENESDPRIQQLLQEGGARLGTGQGFSIRGNETMRALGRRTKAGDIIENIINDYQRAVVRGEKNAVARTFYQFVLDNPAPNLWEIDAEKTKRSLGLDGMVKEKVTLDTDDSTTVAVKLNGEEVFVKVKDPLLVRAIKKMHNNDMGEQLRTMTNGLNVYTSLMRNTLTRFNPEFAIVNLVRDAGFGTLAVLDELGERGVGLFWKHYAAANASSHRYEMGRLDPVNNVADRYFTEYRMAGGTTGGFYMKDADQVRGDIRDMMLAAGASPNGATERVRASFAYQWARKAGRVLEHIGAVSENAARAAAYRAAREMGKTPAEAAKIAKNLTTNFNRKGEYGQLLNSLFVFYNAAVQGSQRTVKMMKNPKVGGYLAGMVASSMAIALANAWGAGDDEDDGEAYWDKIPAHVKERNLIVMLPPGEEADGAERVGSNGRYVAIPVQYGLNVFTTLGYGLADMLRHYGQDKTRGRGALDVGVSLASVTFGSFNPFGGSVDNKHAAAMIFLPSAADVVYQMANGVNAFGTPVAPFKSELDAKPDSENVNARQAGGPAHAIARWVNSVTGGDDTVAGAVDLSPGTLENVWTSLTGGTGRFINDVLTLGMNGLEYANGGDPDIFVNKVPVFRKVYGEVDGAVDQGLFYDRRRRIQEARQEVKAKEESGREVTDGETLALDSMASDANKFTRSVAAIRKEMIEVGKDPDLDRVAKRTYIRELKLERDTLTREFNRMFIETMRSEAKGDFAVAE